MFGAAANHLVPFTVCMPHATRSCPNQSWIVALLRTPAGSHQRARQITHARVAKCTLSSTTDAWQCNISDTPEAPHPADQARARAAGRQSHRTRTHHIKIGELETVKTYRCVSRRGRVAEACATAPRR